MNDLERPNDELWAANRNLAELCSRLGHTIQHLQIVIARQRRRLGHVQRHRAATSGVIRQLRGQLQLYANMRTDCDPYLKDGETPAECIARNRADIAALLSLLSAERTKRPREE